MGQNFIKPEDVIELRHYKLRLCRAEFAQLIGVSLDAVKSWELGRRTCSGPAAVLLRLMAKHPKLVIGHLRQSQEGE